jgi:hypothetical protein
MNPEIVQKLIEAIKGQDDAAALAICEEILAALAGGAPPADATPPDPTAAASDAAPADAPAMAALGREVVRMSKAANAGEAATLIKNVFEAAAKVEGDRVALEQSERRGLVADLVKIGSETPDTAWKRDEAGEIGEGDKRVPVKRLAEEPIAELRSRVVALKKSRPVNPELKVPSGDAPAAITHKLAAELKRRGISVEEFNANKNSAVRRNK